MRLSEKAYRLIKEQIVNLSLEPLSLIDEQALQSCLDLGRTPIREALHRLAAEGLVVIAPRRGMFVSDISITDLAKVFEVRVVLEGLCARLAAERATPEQVSRFENVRGSVRGTQSRQAIMELDQHFHELLYEAANNAFLADTLGRFQALSMRLWYLLLDQLSGMQQAIEQHREIATAVTAGDGELAEILVRQHIMQFQDEIKAAL